MTPPRRLRWPYTWRGRAALGLILIGAYGGAALTASVLVDRPASGLHRSNLGIRHVARLDLSLHALGLRRYAEENGRLPATLAECGSFCPSFRALMDGALVRARGTEVVDEPWARYDGQTQQLAPLAADVKLPRADQDVFGLPMVYTRHFEWADVAGSRVTSWERLADEVMAHVDATGGKLPAPSPEPFTLTSAFLREHDREIRHRIAVAHAQVAVILLSCPLFIAGVLWWVLRARHNRGGSKLGVALAGLVSLATVFLGLGTTVTTCYVPSQHRTSRVGRADRLAYLDRAVARGDVPASVAQAAREYIEKLPP